MARILIKEHMSLPNWAVAVIVGLILNMIMVAYSAGTIVNRLDILMDRFGYLEIRFNDHLKEQHNIRGVQ